MDTICDLTQYKETYRTRLLESILPFWLKHGIDTSHGGIYTGLDRDGTILEQDKSVWFQGRALWAFATTYIDVENNPRYLEVSENLINFIDSYCFDNDNRMFFRVSRDGKPVIKRLRYFFSETFTIIGWAAYSRAIKKLKYANRAFELFKTVLSYRTNPNILTPKFNQETEPSRSFGIPMILINTAQELRKALPDEEQFLTNAIDELIKEIRTFFIREDLKIVLEQCALDGSLMSNHFEGRLLNPGHAIEGSWFILNEAIYRNDDQLQNLGLNMLNWMWEIGWDKKYSGIRYFADSHSKSPSEYWHDMKFWWPQNEAVIANWLAYQLTTDEVYLNRFKTLDSYIHTYFADQEYGEWFGYLHRDNTLSTPLKGNMFKGPFHIPRMYLTCIT